MILVFVFLHIYELKIDEVIVMKVNRQDGWTKNEDETLGKIVLAHIMAGSTQLKAFEEASVTLKRTAAACGFNWNAFLRKEYTDQISQAKKKRTTKNPDVPTVESDYSIVMTQLNKVIEKISTLKEQNDRLEEKNKDLNQVITKLEKQKQQLTEEMKEVKSEYMELINVIKKVTIEPNKFGQH